MESVAPRPTNLAAAAATAALRPVAGAGAAPVPGEARDPDAGAGAGLAGAGLARHRPAAPARAAGRAAAGGAAGAVARADGADAASEPGATSRPRRSGAAVEAAYLAELPRRAGRVWAALDAHQVPYWGRGKLGRFQKGWSGSHSRRLRGYRLYLAVDTDTGQVITFLLARGRTRDAPAGGAAGPARAPRCSGGGWPGVVADCGFTSRAAVAALLDAGVPFILGFARSAPIRAPPGRPLAASSGAGCATAGRSAWAPAPGTTACACSPSAPARRPTSAAPGSTSPACARRARSALAATYRQRWRVEQAIEELLNGHDLDHLVSYRLHPNRVAIGFRLLARNLAIGLQIRDADGPPRRHPRAAPPSAPPTSTASAPSPSTARRSAHPAPLAPPDRHLSPPLDRPHRPPRRLTRTVGIYARVDRLVRGCR